MATNRNQKRRSFRQLEHQLTIVILADLALFLLTLLFSGLGVGFLKYLLGIAVILLSAAGCLFLVLIEEHKRRRSLWMLAAFGALLLCTLVSLLAGYPAPAPAV